MTVELILAIIAASVAVILAVAFAAVFTAWYHTKRQRRLVAEREELLFDLLSGHHRQLKFMSKQLKSASTAEADNAERIKELNDSVARYLESENLASKEKRDSEKALGEAKELINKKDSDIEALKAELNTSKVELNRVRSELSGVKAELKSTRDSGDKSKGDTEKIIKKYTDELNAAKLKIKSLEEELLSKKEKAAKSEKAEAKAKPVEADSGAADHIAQLEADLAAAKSYAVGLKRSISNTLTALNVAKDSDSAEYLAEEIKRGIAILSEVTYKDRGEK